MITTAIAVNDPYAETFEATILKIETENAQRDAQFRKERQEAKIASEQRQRHTGILVDLLTTALKQAVRASPRLSELIRKAPFNAYSCAYPFDGKGTRSVASLMTMALSKPSVGHIPLVRYGSGEIAIQICQECYSSKIFGLKTDFSDLPPTFDKQLISWEQSPVALVEAVTRALYQPP